MEAEHKGLQLRNVWTQAERELFREKYLQHPKNFGQIASFLPRKSVRDCVRCGFCLSLKLWYHQSYWSIYNRQLIFIMHISCTILTICSPQGICSMYHITIKVLKFKEMKKGSCCLLSGLYRLRFISFRSAGSTTCQRRPRTTNSYSASLVLVVTPARDLHQSPSCRLVSPHACNEVKVAHRMQ